MKHVCRGIMMVLHVNALEEMCMATPALAGETLVIRGIRHLFGIRAE